MARSSRPITVTLGDLQARVEERVESGAYASASEVMRAAVRALDREEAAIDSWLRQRVDEALADPRPSIPATEVFKRLRKHHAANAAGTRGKANAKG
jgi:antitoxin ParD1/3/4